MTLKLGTGNWRTGFVGVYTALVSCAYAAQSAPQILTKFGCDGISCCSQLRYQVATSLLCRRNRSVILKLSLGLEASTRTRCDWVVTTIIWRVIPCQPRHVRLKNRSTTFGSLGKENTSHYRLSPTAIISHSSWMISEDVALTSGSPVNIFRINFRSLSFSSSGGTVVIKFSKDISGIRGSDI